MIINHLFSVQTGFCNSKWFNNNSLTGFVLLYQLMVSYQLTQASVFWLCVIIAVSGLIINYSRSHWFGVITSVSDFMLYYYTLTELV